MTDDAFAERLLLHRPTVTGLVCKRLAGRPEADHENLVAEVFERAWTHRASLLDRPDHEIRGYLCQTATNLTIDWLRRQSGRCDVPLLPEQITAKAFLIGGDRHVDVLALRDVLAQMPERERVLLVAAYGVGTDYRTLARERGCSVQAIKHRVHRCREHARAMTGGVAL